MPGPKVLLVVSDRDLQTQLATQLRAAGFQTVTASDGASAIMVAQRQQPQAIVIDLTLPGGDGYLVMKRLKSLAPFATIPIVAVAGRSPTADDEARVAVYTPLLLRKPVEISDLLAALRTALGYPTKPRAEDSQTPRP